ncbi:MAG: shikimate dehydrogenase [Aquifex sp.]|nr:MAG: shikimate dehydrogenase [Aquifex sp.]
MITSETELYGVIGYPVKHSLSPIFQNAFLKWAGINGVYLAFEIDPQNLKEAIEGFKAIGIKGINVTVPHKEVIIPYLEEIDSTAKEIGAVNTVKFRDGKAEGFNTDWIGFIKALKMLLPELKGKKVLLLGAGGASKAVAYGLMKEKSEVYIWNRTREKAERLAKKFGLKVVNSPEEVVECVDVIVNTTTVGLKEDDPELFNYNLIKPDHIVVDIIYKDTKLIQKAKEVGAKFQDGLPMLIWQGIEAFKIWNGCEPPYSVAEKAIKDYLGR